MANFYDLSIKEIREHLGTSQSEGLSSAEAQRRLEEYGQNVIEEKGRKSILVMFFAQFKSLMIIILLLAAAISGVVGVMEDEGLLDTFVILGILVVNALIGAIQEKRAETSLEALKSMAAPASKVLRDGSVSELPARLLVPGDVSNS